VGIAWEPSNNKIFLPSHIFLFVYTFLLSFLTSFGFKRLIPLISSLRHSTNFVTFPITSFEIINPTFLILLTQHVLKKLLCHTQSSLFPYKTFGAAVEWLTESHAKDDAPKSSRDSSFTIDLGRTANTRDILHELSRLEGDWRHPRDCYLACL
jgi:hypothetical protein